MHLSILIETMRREGYEFQVSPPRVLLKQDDLETRVAGALGGQIAGGAAADDDQIKHWQVPSFNQAFLKAFLTGSQTAESGKERPVFRRKRVKLSPGPALA